MRMRALSLSGNQTVKQSGLVARLKASVKSVGRKAVLGGALALASIAGASEARGAMVNEAQYLADNPSVVKLDNFDYFIDKSSGAQYTSNESWADKPFLVRNSVSGEDEISTDKYHFGWVSQLPGGMVFDGSAESGHYGFGDFIEGFYDANLSEGYKPQDLLIVRDLTDDGPGYFNTATGNLIMGTDDTLYTSQDILFGESGVRGDTTQIPVMTPGTTIVQPKMVLDVPEPTTMGLLALGGAGIALTGRRRERRFVKSRVIDSKPLKK